MQEPLSKKSHGICTDLPQSFPITAPCQDFPRQMQKPVLANIDTAGTTNRSPCNTVHRSLVAHGIGAHCTHFWSLGPGVRRARYIKMHCVQTNCESVNMQGNHFQRSHMASAHICRKVFQSPHPSKTSQDKCRSLFWQILTQQEPQTNPPATRCTDLL